MANRRRVGVISAIEGVAHQLAFTPDGKKIVVSDSDGVQMWTTDPLAAHGARLPSNEGEDVLFGLGSR